MFTPRKRPLALVETTPLETIQSGKRSFEQALTDVSRALAYASQARTPDTAARSVIVKAGFYSSLVTEACSEKTNEPDAATQKAAVEHDPKLASAFNEMVRSADLYNQRSMVPVPAQTWRKHQELKKNFG